jgi:exodeoxyribonuclease VII small subunit
MGSATGNVRVFCWSAIVAKKKKDEALSFEDALGELETIVQSMEQGDLSLEDSLSAFEKGIQLTRQCQTSLKDAEQKVQILMDKNGDSQPEPFQGNDKE